MTSTIRHGHVRMAPVPGKIVCKDLTITNPLVLYRALLATKRIQPDAAQYALAHHLHKIYQRLKDYEPVDDYASRLQLAQKALRRRLRNPKDDTNDRVLAVPGHPLRRNPLFSFLFKDHSNRADSLAVTKVLSDHDAAISMDSPRGFMLYGGVGTGKSMLLDMLADSLPNRKKQRWHFSTFMLEIFTRLESIRRSREVVDVRRFNEAHVDVESHDYSLMSIAKNLIESSPILFLDEFQLPDRTTSRVLSTLFTMFFQLGGVLVASSNRLPEELNRASGAAMWTRNRRKGISGWFGLGASVADADDEQSNFARVLRARCEVWEMRGEKDWRRWGAESPSSTVDETAPNVVVQTVATTETTATAFTDGNDVRQDDATSDGLPAMYILPSNDANNRRWDTAVHQTSSSQPTTPITWRPTTLRVYGRDVVIPRALGKVMHATFDELCGGLYGPADYITIASTFHTIILDHVPVLTLLQKNEARRLITLLDALYEARCKLLIRAAAAPDDLFFPETQHPTTYQSEASLPTQQADAVYPETIAEIYQDQTAPFRPNITSYEGAADSRFPESSPTTSSAEEGHEADQPAPGAGNEIGRRIDFGMTSSFTGEDERFAYKRAESRLWEMCGARWHARSGEWWKPLPKGARRWEVSLEDRQSDEAHTASAAPASDGDVKIGESVELEEHAGLQGVIPPR